MKCIQLYKVHHRASECDYYGSITSRTACLHTASLRTKAPFCM